jgi:hypothetical protein
MKKHLKLLGTTLLGVAWTGSLFAGDVLFNFNIDPGSDPALSGALIVGTHNYANGLGNSQLWCSGAGFATNGSPGDAAAITNPVANGYLSITDGTNTANNLAFVFPDVDNGLPIKGFQIDMDLRIGNGCSGRPADGFSISFARSGDQALVDATNGVLSGIGFAGGDGSTTVNGSGDAENGTKTGVAVVFDAWQGNYLPDTQPYNNPPPSSSSVGGGSIGTAAATDREGFAVRVDNHTLIQIDAILCRNEIDCANQTPGAYTGVSLRQTNVVDDPRFGLSIQTGTNAVLTAGQPWPACGSTYGATEANGSFTNLLWEHFMCRLTNDPTPRLTVTWKGVTVVNTNLSVFSPTVGRLVMAGRTGGSVESTHADNIHVNTTPTTNVFLISVQGGLSNFVVNLGDLNIGLANSFLTNILQVILDAQQNNGPGGVATNTVYPFSAAQGGSDVTSLMQWSFSSSNGMCWANIPPCQGQSIGNYIQTPLFLPGSTHKASVAWQDNYGTIISGTLAFVVPQYVPFTNTPMALSAIDTTRVGFGVRAWQSVQNEPNGTEVWADEQVMGFHGPNTIQSGSAILPAEGTFPDGTSRLVWDGPMDWNSSAANTAGAVGFFDYNFDWVLMGFGSGYPGGTYNRANDNMAVEFFGYVYFPSNGLYQMVCGYDDCFQLSTASNPLDRMGQVIWHGEGNIINNNVPPVGTQYFTAVVGAAGVYPIRLLFENGVGGDGLEWYTVPNISQTPAAAGNGSSCSVPTGNSFLVNDTNNICTPRPINTGDPVGHPNGSIIMTFRNLNGSVDVGAYVWRASPARNAANVVSYTPMFIELGNGTGTKTVNTATMTLKVDGNTISMGSPISLGGGLTRWVQTTVPAWSAGFHTNLLTFNDNAGGSYSYTWAWNVIGGPSGPTTADPTNAPMVIPISARVDPSTLNTPGVRVLTHDTPFRNNPGNTGLMGRAADALMDQSGPNYATTAPRDINGNLTAASHVNVVSVWPGPIDFMHPAGTTTYAAGGGTRGEFQYSTDLTVFGLFPPNLDNASGGIGNNISHFNMEFSAFLVFTQNVTYPATYIMVINSDDYSEIMIPAGNQLDNHLAINVAPNFPDSRMSQNGMAYPAVADVGRGGTAPNSAGVFNPGTSLGNQCFAKFTIPAAGAYPFRVLYGNEPGDGMFEWSIWQLLPDGSVARVCINDTNQPGYIPCFAATTAPTGPLISYQQPSPQARGPMPFEPIVIKITDGSGATVTGATVDRMIIDGTNQQFSATKPLSPGNVTMVRQTSGYPLPGGLGTVYWPVANVDHTNTVIFRDSNNVSYTNTWVNYGTGTTFPWVNPFATFQIPASYSVSPGTLTQPGFRIRSAQVVGPGVNTASHAEDILAGREGPNVADQTHTNGPGFFIWTNLLDFSITPNGGPNAGGGEWLFDNCLTNGGLGQGYFIGIPNGTQIPPDPGGAGYTGNLFGFLTHAGTASTAGDQSQDNQVLAISAWLVFPTNGNYIIHGNSDDLERISVPFGNPAGKVGIMLTQGDVGRGTAGAHYGTSGSEEYVPVNIPVAGAYPFRFLWENGGGGGGLEFGIWAPRADGSYKDLLVNDPTDPDSIKAFQVSSQDHAYVNYVSPPINRLVLNGAGNPQLNAGTYTEANATATTGPSGLGYNIGGGQLTGTGSVPNGTQATIVLRSGFRVNPFYVQDRVSNAGAFPIPPVATNDVIVILQDMPGAAVNTATIAMIFSGQTNTVASGTLIVQPNTPVAGQTTVIRNAAAQPYWPSGAYDQLLLSFSDTVGPVTQLLGYAYSEVWGQLANPFPLGSGDVNRRGFLLHTHALDNAVGGSDLKPDRESVAEQVLAGIWTNNFAHTYQSNDIAIGGMVNAYPPGGNYFILAGNGGNGSNGLVNLNPGGPPPGGAANFSSSSFNSSGFPYTDGWMPGIPGTNGGGLPNNNSFVSEFLTYLEFPNPGTYMLGCASDDGFRLTRGWGAANNNGAVLVNSSPAGTLVGALPTAQNPHVSMLTITTNITGNLALVKGTVGFPKGETNWLGNGYSVNGCTINNASQINGNIAIMLQSRGLSIGCGVEEQVRNAAAAGARAVIIVKNNQGTTLGWFPQEPGARTSPQQATENQILPIPVVMIPFNQGQVLMQMAATNGVVNVTITRNDLEMDPAGLANWANSPLGEANYGKGSGAFDTFFPVVVPAAGVYPVRLVYEQGGGGANVEFFTIGTNNAGGTTFYTGTGTDFTSQATNKVLVNDDFATNGPAIKAYYGLTVNPTLSFTPHPWDPAGTTFTVTYQGTLQTNASLYANFNPGPPNVTNRAQNPNPNPTVPDLWDDIYNSGGGTFTVQALANGQVRLFRTR